MGKGPTRSMATICMGALAKFDMIIQAKISQEFAVTVLLDSNNSLLALGTVSAMINFL